MMPKNSEKNTAGMQKKRRDYFNTRRTTSHWPCPIKVKGLQTRTYGSNDLLIDYDALPMNDLSDFEDEIKKLL